MPSINRSALSRHASSPASTASRTRFCAATAFGLGVASSAVECGRSSRSVGVVGGQIIAAGVGIGVMRIESALPGQRALEIGALAGRLVKRERGADHGGVVRGQARQQQLALRARNGRAGRHASSPLAMKSKARRAMASHDGSSSATPALTSAAIISPFQSASTLSSSPGRTRSLAHAAGSCATARAGLVGRRCASLFASRLRILWPSKLPSSLTS